MKAVIIPCTEEKVWDTDPARGPVPAKDAYAKPVFAKWRAHAEQLGVAWFILSTKYGLLSPDDLVEPYNVPIGAALADPRLHSLLEIQGRRLGLDNAEEVVLLDWEKFQPLVRAAVANPLVPCKLRRLFY